ncbi:MAG: MOSC N-terminal beta barrel domain-containing protein, partial [Bacteroidota bacterium]
MKDQSPNKTPNPQVSHLRVYPIKSLDSVNAEAFEVGIRSLKQDRMFAMIDEDGRYINGKRTGRVNQLKAEYDLSNHLVYLSERSQNESGQAFELREGNDHLNEYISDFFQIKSSLIYNDKGAFMDIPGASSVTVVSEASLRSLQKDFPGHSLEDLRLRFRTNIELSGVEAFWEEQLFQSP